MSDADDQIEYLRDFDPQSVHEVPADTPFCIVVLETAEVAGGYVPSVVYKDVSGHFPLSGREGGAPWVWGPSLEQAKAQAVEYNAQIGVSPELAREILMSSFRQAGDQGKL